MIIKKSESKKHANSPNCIAYEYDHKDRDINISFIEINGRYPDRGRVMNTVCKEIVFVVRGRGKIEIEGKELSVSEGDSIFIRPNQRYLFNGNLEIIASCYPTWYPEQHVECD